MAYLASSNLRLLSQNLGVSPPLLRSVPILTTLSEDHFTIQLRHLLELVPIVVVTHEVAVVAVVDIGVV